MRDTRAGIGKHRDFSIIEPYTMRQHGSRLEDSPVMEFLDRSISKKPLHNGDFFALLTRMCVDVDGISVRQIAYFAKHVLGTIGDVLEPEPWPHVHRLKLTAVLDQRHAGLERVKEILGRMIGCVWHQMHPQSKGARRIRPLVQETVHIHDGRGTTLQRLHVADEAAKIGIHLGQCAMLTLVPRQPVHELRILAEALEQTGVRMHIDQARQDGKAALAVDDPRVRRNMDVTRLADRQNCVLIEHQSTIRVNAKVPVHGIDARIENRGHIGQSSSTPDSIPPSTPRPRRSAG